MQDIPDTPEHKKCFCHFFDQKNPLCIGCKHQREHSVSLPDEIAALPNEFHAMYRNAPILLTRDALSTLSGGAISTKMIANHDAKKKGPKKKALFNRKVVYCRKDAIIWLFKFFDEQK